MLQDVVEEKLGFRLAITFALRGRCQEKQSAKYFLYTFAAMWVALI